jgi:hypothetical protein
MAVIGQVNEPLLIIKIHSCSKKIQKLRDVERFRPKEDAILQNPHCSLTKIVRVVAASWEIFSEAEGPRFPLLKDSHEPLFGNGVPTR